jgi:hypothetical protein
MALTFILSLTSPLAALVIAVWGFRRHDRSAELSMLFEMQDRYLGPQVREGRRLIHLKIAPGTAESLESCTREERSTIGYALAIMNTIALCADSGQVSEALLRDSMGRSFASTMRAAQPFIDQVAAVRGFRPYPFAVRLAERFDSALGGKPRGNEREAQRLLPDIP